jgi:hypothetical protein
MLLLSLQTVIDIQTIMTYASLTSTWITNFHPSVAYLLAYFDFNEVHRFVLNVSS